MARKPVVPIEIDSEEAGGGRLGDFPAGPAPVRRQRTRSERGWRERMPGWLGWAGGLLAIVAVIALAYRVDQFLASDRHFVLAASADPAHPSGLRVSGVAYTSRERILRVFAADVGRSIYLIPLADRRRNLMAIDWVQNASVSRHWPAGVSVGIVERTPVAFAVLPAGGRVFRTALIDADGVILEPPPRARFELPVLLGIRAEQPAPTRRARVALMLQLLEEIRSYSGQLSEVDVGDPENVIITQTVEGHAVRLLLGRERYLPRLKNFLSHYGEIQRRLPGTTTFDLRLDDRITALEGAAHGK
jgi:cell division protein FtsQ